MADGDSGNAGESWLDGLSEENKGYVANSGFETPDAVVASYRELRTLTQGSPESLIQLPSVDADKEAWDPVFTKLGRPENAAGYEIPESKDDPKFKGFLEGTFHTLGLSKTQAKGLYDALHGRVETVLAADEDAYKVLLGQEKTSLAREWGQATEQNTQRALTAGLKLGLSEDAIAQMQVSQGYVKTMQFLHNVAQSVSEDTFAENRFGQNNGEFGSALTPAQANDKIMELRSDSDFTKRYLAGDTLAVAKMDELQKAAAAGVAA